MTERILGIDLGASTTDFVLMEGKRVYFKESMPSLDLDSLEKKIKSVKKNLGGISFIALTGGKSAFFPSRFSGIKVKKVNEINAIGAGGLFLSGKKRALVASLGTGTCIVSMNGSIARHCCGTGVSGGTLVGLSKKLLGFSDLKRFNSLAKKGSLKRIDLSVMDIVGKGIGNLPGNATASNFAKAGNSTKADIAIGIANLVAEANASIVSLSAQKCRQHDIVLTGKLLSVPVVKKRLLAGLKLLGCKAVVPRHYEIATAIGACVL